MPPLIQQPVTSEHNIDLLHENRVHQANLQSEIHALQQARAHTQEEIASNEKKQELLTIRIKEYEKQLQELDAPPISIFSFFRSLFCFF